jgi:molecular chaperone GrpE
MNHQDEGIEPFSPDGPLSEQLEEESGEETLESPGGEGEEGTVAEEKGELETARQEATDNYDKFLRVYAEFENYKKRMEKDKADFLKYANEELIKELLAVIDNLERAVAQAKEKAEPVSLIQGVEMILKQMKDILEKNGLREVQALGEPFDPNFHEAMMHEIAEEHEENTVIDELQKGYVLRDRLIRPALVKVSKKS